MYIKMVNKYYQKEVCERYKNFLKKKIKKSLSIIMIKIRIFLKKENQKELVTCGFELVTSRFELLTRGVELHNMWICARNS